MAPWVAIQLAALVATFGSIVWGVVAFFVAPSHRAGRAAWLSAVALLGFANQVVATWHAPSDALRAAAATTMYLTSISVFWSAVRACARRRPTAIFEPDTPTQLVLEGPYRRIRHPFYTSYTIFWLAGWVGCGAWSTALIALVMTCVYVRAARSEEAKFEGSSLAAAYHVYRQQTGFFCPRWRRHAR